MKEEIAESRWKDYVTVYPKAVESYIERTASGDDEAVSRLAENWDQFKEIGRRSSGSAVGPKVDDPRWEALGEILATRASRDGDVVRFRKDHLGSRLIEPGRVESWIKETALSDGAPTTWIRVALGDGDRLESVESALAANRVPPENEFLVYRVPKSRWTHSLPVRDGGALWQLRRTARRVTAGFGWPEAVSSTFVLTDEAPERPFTFGYTEHLGEIVPAADWVELRVNPRAVSPEDLAAAYRLIRSNIIGGGKGKRRVRRLTPKSARLAVFWEKTEGEGMSTVKRRAEWNRRYPEWMYPDPGTNFGRDGRTAHRNVVGESKSIPLFISRPDG